MISNETENQGVKDPSAATSEVEGAPNTNPTISEAEEAQRKRELEDLRTMLHIRELETKVKTYESKLSDIREYVKKIENETEAVRQRTAREAEKTADRRISEFLVSLLKISDNFDLSIKTATGDTSPLAEGIRMIHSQFAQFLQSAGLEKLNPKGEVFDPHQHEALTTIPTTIKEMDNVVVEEVKAGYRFKDATLRPASVVVGRFESSEDKAGAH